MVHVHLPCQLTEEEELLMQKYAKLRKKKKALSALKAPKVEKQESVTENNKRSADAAADATDRAKKLIKSGAIKLGGVKKDQQTFKRKRGKETETKSAVSFQPFSYGHGGGDNEDDRLDVSTSARPKARYGLYDNFVPSSSNASLTRESDAEEMGGRRDSGGEEFHRREGSFSEGVRREGGRRESFEGGGGRRESGEWGRGGREGASPRGSGGGQRGNTVYVHGFGLTEELMRKAFAPVGAIVNISVQSEQNCSFVTFDKMESADQAIEEINGSLVAGIQLKVSMARRQPAVDSAPPGGGASGAGASGDGVSGSGASMGVTSAAASSDALASWTTLAANNSQKSSHRDKRDLVSYDDDFF